MLQIDTFGVQTLPTRLVITPKSMWETDTKISNFHVKDKILGTYQASIKNNYLTIEINSLRDSLSSEIVLSGISTGYIKIKRGKTHYLDSFKRTVFTKQACINYANAEKFINDPNLNGLALLCAVGKTQNYTLVTYELIKSILDFMLNKTHMYPSEKYTIEQFLLGSTITSLADNVENFINKLTERSY